MVLIILATNSLLVKGKEPVAFLFGCLSNSVDKKV